MANLYDINEKLYFIIENGLEPETGEILDETALYEAINETELELTSKLENIACYIKNLSADVEALKEEKKKIAQRQKTKENKIESLKRYLDNYFRYAQPDYFEKEGKFHKFETPKCVIGYRKSDTVAITDVNKIPTEYIKPRVIKETDISKENIKKYLTENPDNEVSGARLLHNKNIQIK